MNKETMIPCFKCGKTLNRVADNELQPYGGTAFSTYGHYGSTFWDSFHGEEIVVIICDECLNANKSKIARRKRYVNVLSDDLSSGHPLPVVVGRYWIERESVPWFDGDEDESGDFNVEPEQIGNEKVDGAAIEWTKDWRIIKESLVAAAEKWDEGRA